MDTTLAIQSKSVGETLSNVGTKVVEGFKWLGRNIVWLVQTVAEKLSSFFTNTFRPFVTETAAPAARDFWNNRFVPFAKSPGGQACGAAGAAIFCMVVADKIEEPFLRRTLNIASLGMAVLTGVLLWKQIG